MNILHLTGRLNARGGAGVHLLGVVRAQAAAGHTVVVAAGAIDATGVPGTVVAVPGLDARTRTPAALDPLVERFAPDLVHLHTVVNPHVLEWARGRPSVITVQDHRYFCPSRGKWTAEGRPCTEALGRDLCASCFDDPAYFDAIWSLTRERLDALAGLRVVVLSEYMRGALVQAGLDGARVHVVPPFVSESETDVTAAPVGPACVLFAGRLTASKGVDDAVEAWRRADVGLPLLMAGKGALRESAERRGATALGWVEHADKAALFRRAAALLMPSRWQEPFGIVGLEALTAGVPVVAWRSGGIAEWHPGGDTLVEWGDVDGLAAALRRAIGRRAKAPAGFAKDALMSRLEAVYERARG